MYCSRTASGVSRSHRLKRGTARANVARRVAKRRSSSAPEAPAPRPKAPGPGCPGASGARLGLALPGGFGAGGATNVLERGPAPSVASQSGVAAPAGGAAAVRPKTELELVATGPAAGALGSIVATVGAPAAVGDAAAREPSAKSLHPPLAVGAVGRYGRDCEAAPAVVEAGPTGLPPCWIGPAELSAEMAPFVGEATVRGAAVLTTPPIAPVGVAPMSVPLMLPTVPTPFAGAPPAAFINVAPAPLIVGPTVGACWTAPVIAPLADVAVERTPDGEGGAGTETPGTAGTGTPGTAGEERFGATGAESFGAEGAESLGAAGTDTVGAAGAATPEAAGTAAVGTAGAATRGAAGARGVAGAATVEGADAVGAAGARGAAGAVGVDGAAAGVGAEGGTAGVGAGAADVGAAGSTDVTGAVADDVVDATGAGTAGVAGGGATAPLSGAVGPVARARPGATSASTATVDAMIPTLTADAPPLTPEVSPAHVSLETGVRINSSHVASFLCTAAVSVSRQKRRRSTARRAH